MAIEPGLWRLKQVPPKEPVDWQAWMIVILTTIGFVAVMTLAQIFIPPI
jgi:hypothetical protein